MRLTLSILLLLAFLLTAGSSLFVGCEEKLEICPPCGLIENKNVNITGNSRIDGTFAAVQNLKDAVDNMSKRADKATIALSSAFAPVAEEGESLTATIKTFFSSASITSAGSSVVFGACSVDTDFADNFQNICENTSCSVDRPASGGLCRGWSSGTCKDVSSGSCFHSSAAACADQCIGVCEDTDEGDCPGTCLGTCDGFCLSHNEKGLCAGPCDGFCTGICESDLPFFCAGTCKGACDEALSDAGCDDTDTFSGFCNDSDKTGNCRGHYYPQGCGEDCSACTDAAADCREVSKFLAWTKMICTPSDLRISAQVSDDTSAALTLSLVRALERELAPIADDYVRLSLLLNGYDPRTDRSLTAQFGNSDNSSLDDGVDRYYDYSSLEDKDIPPLDIQRAYFPAEALKARIYWLGRTAVNSSGGFNINAGTYDCLQPALDSAAELMLKMVPAAGQTDDEDNFSYSADTTCETVKSTEDTDPECLYALLERQAALLNLIDFE
jgi:hypothetical protein